MIYHWMKNPYSSYRKNCVFGKGGLAISFLYTSDDFDRVELIKDSFDDIVFLKNRFY